MRRQTPAHAPGTSPAPTQDSCDHVNQHWTGEDEMRCQLPRGHAGNHAADYVCSDGMTARGEWTDMAGTPVAEFEHDLPAQIQRRIDAAAENQRRAAEEMEKVAVIASDSEAIS